MTNEASPLYRPIYRRPYIQRRRRGRPSQLPVPTSWSTPPRFGLRRERGTCPRDGQGARSRQSSTSSGQRSEVIPPTGQATCDSAKIADGKSPSSSTTSPATAGPSLARPPKRSWETGRAGPTDDRLQRARGRTRSCSSSTCLPRTRAPREAARNRVPKYVPNSAILTSCNLS